MLVKIKTAFSHSILLLFIICPYLINSTRNSSFILSFVWLILGLLLIEFIYQKLSEFSIQKFIIPSVLVLLYYDQFIYLVQTLNSYSFEFPSLKARYFIPIIWLFLVFLFQQVRPKLKGRFIIVNCFLLIYSCSILFTHFLENQKQEKPSSHFIPMKSDKSKPVILIVLDEYASPEELVKNLPDSSLFNFNHHLQSRGWQVQSNQYSYNLKTANSLSSLFNYNYKSTDSELNVTESVKSLKESKLILDLQKKGIKTYNYGIFDLGDSNAFSKIYFYEEESFKSDFFKQLFANSMLRLLYEPQNSQQLVHNRLLIEYGYKNIREMNNSNAFIYLHLLMPHMPFEYKGAKNYTSKSNLNTVGNFIAYWKFSNSLVYDMLLQPLAQSNQFKLVITGDHGYRWEKDKVNPQKTITAFYGFEKYQTNKIKSVQDLGSLIYSSY